MEYSNIYQSRHGFVNLDTLDFNITNSKDESTIDCKLIKVPEYTKKFSYHENISEGNGWYSKGEKRSVSRTFNSYYLIILNNKCLGMLDISQPSSISSKFPISTLNGYKEIKEFLKTIKINAKESPTKSL